MSAAKRHRGPKNPRRRPTGDSTGSGAATSGRSPTGSRTGRSNDGEARSADRRSSGSALRNHRKLMVYLLAGAFVLLVAVRATVDLEAPIPASAPSGSSAAAAATAPSPAQPGPMDAGTEGAERAATPADGASRAAAEPQGSPSTASQADVDPRRGIFGVDESGEPSAASRESTVAASATAPDARSDVPPNEASPAAAEADEDTDRRSRPGAAAEALPVGGASASGAVDPAPAVVFPWLDPAALVRAATDPEAPSTVRLVVRTRPAGARVLLAGRPIGTTPLEASVAATGLTPLRVDVPDEPGVRGYAPFDGVLDLSHDVELELELFPR